MTEVVLPIALLLCVLIAWRWFVREVQRQREHEAFLLWCERLKTQTAAMSLALGPMAASAAKATRAMQEFSRSFQQIALVVEKRHGTPEDSA